MQIICQKKQKNFISSTDSDYVLDYWQFKSFCTPFRFALQITLRQSDYVLDYWQFKSFCTPFRFALQITLRQTFSQDSVPSFHSVSLAKIRSWIIGVRKVWYSISKFYSKISSLQQPYSHGCLLTSFDFTAAQNPLLDFLPARTVSGQIISLFLQKLFLWLLCFVLFFLLFFLCVCFFYIHILHI